MLLILKILFIYYIIQSCIALWIINYVFTRHIETYRNLNEGVKKKYYMYFRVESFKLNKYSFMLNALT